MSSSYVTLPPPAVPAPFRLRALSMENVDGLGAVYAEPEVARSLNFEVPLRPETIRQKLIRDLDAMRRGESFRWVLCLEEDPTPLGYMCLFNWTPKDRRAEVGYMVSRKLWGQGVMKQLLPVLVRFGFEQMGLHRLEATVSVHNPASLRVLLRAGFQHEGLLRGLTAAVTGDGFIDMNVLGLLKDAWRESAT